MCFAAEADQESSQPATKNTSTRKWREVFTRKTTANSWSQTMLSGWYSVQQILHDIVWPDICTAGIKHLRWRNSATLQTAKPVNHSEISRDCDNTPSRLHIWDFRVVMLSIALLCRHTASCKCSFGFCIHCWKDCGELVMTSYILLFCDSACDICCIYYLEGLSNVYCCCYAWSIQNTHFAAHI